MRAWCSVLTGRPSFEVGERVLTPRSRTSCVEKQTNKQRQKEIHFRNVCRWADFPADAQPPIPVTDHLAKERTLVNLLAKRPGSPSARENTTGGDKPGPALSKRSSSSSNTGQQTAEHSALSIYPGLLCRMMAPSSIHHKNNLLFVLTSVPSFFMDGETRYCTAGNTMSSKYDRINFGCTWDPSILQIDFIGAWNTNKSSQKLFSFTLIIFNRCFKKRQTP